MDKGGAKAERGYSGPMWGYCFKVAAFTTNRN